MPTPGGRPIILPPDTTLQDISNQILQVLMFRERLKAQREQLANEKRRLELAERADARDQRIADRTAAEQSATDRAAADLLLGALGFSGGTPQGVDPLAMLQGGQPSAFGFQSPQAPAEISPASPFNLAGAMPVEQPLAPGASGAVTPPAGPPTPGSPPVPLGGFDPVLAQQLMANPQIAGAVRDLGRADVPSATANQRVRLAAAEAQRLRDIRKIVTSIPKLTRDQRTQLQSVLEARDRMTAEAFNDAVSLILPPTEQMKLNMQFVAQQIETMRRSGQATADERVADIAATAEAKRLGVFPTTFPEYVPGAANMFLRLREIAAQKAPKAADVSGLIINYVRARANDVKAGSMIDQSGNIVLNPRVTVQEAAREIIGLTRALGIVEEGSPLDQRLNSPAFMRLLEQNVIPTGSFAETEQIARGIAAGLQQQGVASDSIRAQIRRALAQDGVPSDTINSILDRVLPRQRR